MEGSLLRCIFPAISNHRHIKWNFFSIFHSKVRNNTSCFHSVCDFLCLNEIKVCDKICHLTSNRCKDNIHIIVCHTSGICGKFNDRYYHLLQGRTAMHIILSTSGNLENICSNRCIYIKFIKVRHCSCHDSLLIYCIFCNKESLVCIKAFILWIWYLVKLL